MSLKSPSYVAGELTLMQLSFLFWEGLHLGANRVLGADGSPKTQNRS